MSDFEWIYKDGVPTEKMFNIEKPLVIEKSSVPFEPEPPKELEKESEQEKSESVKRKPKRVSAKPNKAAVAGIQKKLSKRSR